MGKKKRKRKKPRSELRRTELNRRVNKQQQSGASQNYFFKFWRLFAGLAIILSLIGLYFQLSPSLIISAPTILDPFKPLNNPFIVQNEGYLPVYSLTWTCEAFVDQYSPGLVPGISFSGIGYTSGSIGPVSKLSPKEQTLVSCPHVESTNPGTLPATLAHATIKINFKARWVPWSADVVQRFVASKDHKGQFVWLPVTVVPDRMNKK